MINNTIEICEMVIKACDKSVPKETALQLLKEAKKLRRKLEKQGKDTTNRLART
jgi:hypothetical protein